MFLYIRQSNRCGILSNTVKNKPRPIMLKILPITLLRSAQKIYPLYSILYPSSLKLCHNLYAALLLLFNDCFIIVRLQPVVFYIMLCCSALIFYTLCSILCSWENLRIILHWVGMITMSQINIKYKSDDQHDNYYVTNKHCYV